MIDGKIFIVTCLVVFVIVIRYSHHKKLITFFDIERQIKFSTSQD